MLVKTQWVEMTEAPLPAISPRPSRTLVVRMSAIRETQKPQIKSQTLSPRHVLQQDFTAEPHSPTAVIIQFQINKWLLA